MNLRVVIVLLPVTVALVLVVLVHVGPTCSLLPSPSNIYGTLGFPVERPSSRRLPGPSHTNPEPYALCVILFNASRRLIMGA